MLSAQEIRQQFLDFFEEKKHRVVRSAPIVVKNDPTLMFTNAGMNQFKDYFLGNKTAEAPRVCDTQKCLRVSGKHNDLEEVGVDTYHHTMFEMLGNWSFGDYFKKEAIAWSWELLTGVFGIDQNNLYVTIFEGDENVPKDTEAEEEWKKHIAPERILSGNKKDNFWEMGDTGPCGPCTEIHVDCRSEEEKKQIPGKDLVNQDHPQVIEIWNNVFIQYNRKKDGSLEELPAKHVDTGMGLERLVRVLQKKQSNYDTDLFTGTIEETEKICGQKYNYSDTKTDISFRVIADHIRAICFTIADGQLPSNTGAGYVVRRILRRAVRYYFSYLDYKQPLLHQLVPALAKQFEHVFPELKKQETFVAKVILEEENSFLNTLDKGLRRIDELVENISDHHISGKDAFELYDTYGFPFDLTQLIAQENNLQVDEKGFHLEMQKQKERSKSATTLDNDDWQLLDEGSNAFVGYECLQKETHVLQYRKVSAKNKHFYQLVLAQTPFYAESGGQVGDTGVLQFGEENIPVFDTKKENDLILHYTNKLPQEIQGRVSANVHAERRQAICIHHSATHLLHAALRKVLGTHVAQKGSLVNDEHLRFDFSHIQKVSDEEIIEIEKIVNAKIRENVPVFIKTMPKEDALQLGAMALFGEKYGDEVRVVIMDKEYSVELCGGTHVGHTGELGFFKITHESAIAAGVRRVEAFCGERAEDYVQQEIKELQEIKNVFKNPKNIVASIEQVLEEKKALQKQMDALHDQQRKHILAELLQDPENIHGVPFIGKVIQTDSADSLKKLCFELKNKLEGLVVVLAASINGKPHVCILIDEKTAKEKNISANHFIRNQVAPLIQGGGGGQDHFASAGGSDPSGLEDVIKTVKSQIT